MGPWKVRPRTGEGLKGEGPNPEKVAPREKGGSLEWWGPEGWSPKIHVFPPSRPNFLSFCVSLEGLLRGILVVHWKRPDTQMCTFGEPNWAHLRARAFKNTTTIEREDTQREKKSENGDGEGKKRAKFWAVLRRAVLCRAVKRGRGGEGGPA